MREAKYWLLFLLCGIAMGFFLVVHMGLMHLEGILRYIGIETGEVLAFASVMGRAATNFWTIFYIIFLAVALYHGYYGLRGVLLELSRGKSGDKIITSLVVLVALVAFVFGAFVTVKSYTG